MGTSARQGQNCRISAPVADALLSQDLDGWWRAAYASDASVVGRKRLGTALWRANHAGGQGTYVPRPSDFLRLARLGLSRARIIALCDDLKARLLAAVVEDESVEPIHLCTSRVARETGEAMSALVLAIGDGGAESRATARRELAEARVEIERASLALCSGTIGRGRAD